MLEYFVEHADRLIDRDELMHAVWPDVIVTDDSIAQCIGEIRRVLGGDSQRYLRTVQRRGYRFAGPVQRVAVTEPPEPTDVAPASRTDQQPGSRSPDHPTIAVLPFQNMSGDPEQEYFADGMVEEIITALSRIRWLFVIARNSSFIYKGRAVDIKQVGRELGVRYVLEGSVRRSAERRADHRAVDRRAERRASLGRPFRWAIAGCICPAGQDRDCRCGDHRADSAGR